MSAVAYQTVNRPRMLATLGADHVSHAAHRVNQLGFFGVIDLLTQPGDDHVHDVRAGIEVIIPGVFGDQRAGHHPALMAHQVLEHGVFRRRELDALTVAGHLATARVQHQPVYLELRWGDCLGPPSQRLDARQQLLERKGLGDVVVRSHAQRLDLEVDGVLRGQYEHGKPDAAIAQRAQHLDAGELGQAEIEDHHVVPGAPPPPPPPAPRPPAPPAPAFAARAPQPFIAVADEIDMIAGLIQPTANVLTYRFVVLNDQDLHSIGRKTLKLVPTPTWDSTSMRPRCSSTMPYATDRPRPVPRPCGLVVKNGSKILGRSSCRMPVPVSMNSARISSLRCGLRRVRTVRTPREFIASIAFSISAMKHCTSRSASAWKDDSPGSSCRSIVSHLKRS